MADVDIVLPTAQVETGLYRAIVAFSNIAGTTSRNPLASSGIVVTDSDGKIAISHTSSDELDMLDGIGTETVKNQLDGKTNLASTIVSLAATDLLTMNAVHLITGSTDPVVLTLPVGVAGKQITVKCVAKGAGAITIKPNTGGQIDSLGADVSVPISIANQSFTLIAKDATTWYII